MYDVYIYIYVGDLKSCHQLWFCKQKDIWVLSSLLSNSTLVGILFCDHAGAYGVFFKAGFLVLPDNSSLTRGLELNSLSTHCCYFTRYIYATFICYTRGMWYKL